ncbi:unnamed protein product [Diamesa serratosioi]
MLNIVKTNGRPLKQKRLWEIKVVGNSFTTTQSTVFDNSINSEAEADTTDNWVSGGDREFHEIQYLIRKCDEIRARELEALTANSVVKLENIEECQEKFRVILSELLINTHCDDMLLSKLSSILSTKDYSDFLNDSATNKWIEAFAIELNSTAICFQQQNVLFAINILSILCLNEWQFATIEDKNILELVQNGIKKYKQSSISLCHIKLLRSISKHSMGLIWLKKIKAWKIAIMYYQTFPTIDMMSECASFLYDIISKFSDLMMDSNLCNEIMEDIFVPINKVAEEIQMEIFETDLMPTIEVCSYILTMCIESQKTSRTAHFILVKFQFEKNLWTIGELIGKNHDFISGICRGLITANFATFTNIDEPPDKATKLSSYENFTSNCYKIINFAIKRQSFANILVIADLHHTLWNKLSVQKNVKNVHFKIAHQVITMQTLPLVQMIKSKLSKTNQFMCEIATNVLQKNNEETVRLIYQYRDCLNALESEALTELAVKSIQSTSSLKETLDRDSIILALKILIYALAGYIDEPCNENFNRPTVNEQLLMKSEIFLSALLIGLGNFINDFTISWKECLESTSIVRFSLILLDCKSLNSKLKIEALKLVQICIEHFLAPNLALLNNNLNNSGLETLGSIIYKQLHDECWTVRSSALDLLISVVEISDKKFPAFQKHILDSHICNVVNVIARNDFQPAVRASALRCLNLMIPIKMIWNCALHSFDLLKLALQLIGNEKEDAIRYEAVGCLTTIYLDQHISKDYLDYTFSVLAHGAVKDSCTNVRVKALLFWRVVICRQFRHQGMVDGTFPAVTFSKEHKKIITLTQKEIFSRIKRVSNELALRGCLGVLIACVKDENYEVLQTALPTIEKILGYIDKYNYMEQHRKFEADENVPKTPFIDSNFSEFRAPMVQKSIMRNNADFCRTVNVLQSSENGEINKTNDQAIEDMINLHLEDFGISCNLIGKIDKYFYKQFAQVSEEDFLDFLTGNELRKLLEDRATKSLNIGSFKSLLEDILESFQQNITDLTFF